MVTATVEVPNVVKSDAGMLVSIVVDDCTVIDNGVPPNETVVVATKPVPVIVSDVVALPSSAVFGDNNAIVGTGLFTTCDTAAEVLAL